jgi:multiple sugar transport system substrate-binding protein
VNAATDTTRRRMLAGAAVAGMPGWTKAAARRKLTVTAYPNVDAIVKASLPAWQRLHPDVDIEVVSRQYVDHHTAMTTALSTSVYLPDVMALESSFVGRFAQGGGLDDLSLKPYEVQRFRSRFVPFAYDQAVNRRGAVVAVPTDIGPGTLLYRHDLLARSGVAEADLIRSWDSYIDAGVRIKAKTGAHLIGSVQMLKDIVIRSGLLPGEGLYFDEASRVLVTSRRFVRGFELARKVRQQRLDARLVAWTGDWAEGFKRGTLATEPTGAWMVGQLAAWVAPETRGLWRAAQLPEGTFVGYGGSFYAIPRLSDAANKALAWDFIQLMTLDRDRQFSAFKSEDAFPALLETFDDPFFEQALPFLGGQPARLLWRDAARRIRAMSVHKQNMFAEEVINTELDNVLDRGKDIQQALADAARLLERRAHR